MYRTTITLLAASLLSGCASVHNLTHTKRPYGGLRDDLRIVAYPFTSSQSRGGAPVDGLAAVMFIPCVIDTPFSFVLDTITLPYTALISQRKDKDSNKMPGHVP